MNKTIGLLIIFSFLSLQFLVAQEFSEKEQYNQAMKNAKQAFNAQQFSEAIMFYREAMKINPDALLPKYKIEDIRTIYIAKELNSTPPTPTTKITNNKKKKKKAIEEEEILKVEIAKKEATRKMNEDADKLQAELKEVNFETLNINEDTDVLDLEDEVIENTEKDKVAVIKETIIIEQPKIDENSINSTVPISQKQQTPSIKKPQEESIAEAQENKNKPIIKETQSTTKPIQTPDLDKKIWIAQEKEKLLVKYPNKKTVEEIDKPNKHITRVIMNINNKVTIYLKVKHSWGATYFFMDEVGLELKSISENYYNIKTNIKNYGG